MQALTICGDHFFIPIKRFFLITLHRSLSRVIAIDIDKAIYYLGENVGIGDNLYIIEDFPLKDIVEKYYPWFGIWESTIVIIIVMGILNIAKQTYIYADYFLFISRMKRLNIPLQFKKKKKQGVLFHNLLG